MTISPACINAVSWPLESRMHWLHIVWLLLKVSVVIFELCAAQVFYLFNHKKNLIVGIF